MAGGDGAGLAGDGGVGGFELGLAPGEFGPAFGQLGAELREGVYGDAGRVLGVVLGQKQLGKAQNVVGKRLASGFDQVDIVLRDAEPLA